MPRPQVLNAKATGGFQGSRCGEDPLPGPHVSIEPIVTSILFTVHRRQIYAPLGKRVACGKVYKGPGQFRISRLARLAVQGSHELLQHINLVIGVNYRA